MSGGEQRKNWLDFECTYIYLIQRSSYKNTNKMNHRYSKVIFAQERTAIPCDCWILKKKPASIKMSLIGDLIQVNFMYEVSGYIVYTSEIYYGLG